MLTEVRGIEKGTSGKGKRVLGQFVKVNSNFQSYNI